MSEQTTLGTYHLMKSKQHVDRALDAFAPADYPSQSNTDELEFAQDNLGIVLEAIQANDPEGFEAANRLVHADDGDVTTANSEPVAAAGDVHDNPTSAPPA